MNRTNKTYRTYMDSLLKDIRYGLRGLLKRPGFTAIALVALALGIGANSAIFSLVNAVVLRPLPFPEPDRLVWVYGNIRSGGNRASVSPLDFLDYRSQNKTFEQFAASGTVPLPMNLTGSGDPERLTASNVTGNYFDAFKVTPALGRGFTLENEKTGADQVTVLSHAFWQTHFGAEVRLPECVTEYGDLVRASLFVFECEAPAERRRYFECVKIISGDIGCGQTFRITAEIG